MKKYFVRTLFAVLILSGCKESQKNSEKSDFSEITDVAKQKMKQEDSTPQSTKSVLPKEEVSNFFPKQIGDYKLIYIDDNLLKTNGIASGMYIKGNDYDHSLTYTLEDGNRKGSAILKNFEDGYKSTAKGPAGTEYLRKERNGYKTIAYLQHNIHRYSISFIYNQRFMLSLVGVEKPDVLWTYFKKEDLQKLNALNQIK